MVCRLTTGDVWEIVRKNTDCITHEIMVLPWKLERKVLWLLPKVVSAGRGEKRSNGPEASLHL